MTRTNQCSPVPFFFRSFVHFYLNIEKNLIINIHSLYTFSHINLSSSHIIHSIEMTRTSSKTTNMTKIELKKLKSILPSLKQKPTTTPIEIVLETIRYIRQLEDQLMDRFQMDGTNFNSQLSLSDVSTSSIESSLTSPLQEIGNSN